jgi:hypothetical protein
MFLAILAKTFAAAVDVARKSENSAQDTISLTYDMFTFMNSSSPYIQSYHSLYAYFLIATALCSVLAGLAYLLSLSTAQDVEKRSEYECGFAPFDSATRLPFDVHFYLEVALLFP